MGEYIDQQQTRINKTTFHRPSQLFATILSHQSSLCYINQCEGPLAFWLNAIKILFSKFHRKFTRHYWWEQDHHYLAHIASILCLWTGSVPTCSPFDSLLCWKKTSFVNIWRNERGGKYFWTWMLQMVAKSLTQDDPMNSIQVGKAEFVKEKVFF